LNEKTTMKKYGLTRKQYMFAKTVLPKFLEREYLTMSDIMKFFPDRAYSTIYFRVKRLVEKGLIRQKKNIKAYELTSLGKKFLKEVLGQGGSL